MALITWLNKDADFPDDDPQGMWRDIDANEVKLVVNTNQNELPATIAAAVDALEETIDTAKQDTLVSGTNIKTVQGNSIVGSGDVVLISDGISNGSMLAPTQNVVFDALTGKQATLVSGTNIKTINGSSILGSGNLSLSALTGLAFNLGATAVADGATDDRAAIQTAYDTAYTAGERVFYLPAGNYFMGIVAGTGIYANLFIKPGTYLFGDGDATIITRDPAETEGYAITYDRTAHNAADLEDRNYALLNFRIIGATIGRGFEQPGTSENDGGIFLAVATNRSNRVLISGVTVEHPNKEAIAVWDAEEVIIKHCKVYDCNHDAYNPQLIRSLILTNNYSYGCNFAVEYDGRRSGGVRTDALIANNEFVNTYEYGIGVQAGDRVKISNNLLVGQQGSTTVTFQSIGIYLLPNQGAIDMLEVSGNQITNFIQGGLSNSTPDTSDNVISRLIVKGNTFLYNGENCVRLKSFSTAKILHTEITGNTCNYWNRIDNGSAHQWSAIHLENIDNVSVHGNNFRNVTNGTRNDPLFIKNTSNVRFFNNDCTGPATAFNSTLEIKTDGTNTGLVSFNNPGLSGSASGFSTIKESIVPTGTINGVNMAFVLPDTPASGTLKLFADGIRLTIDEDFTLSGANITMLWAPETTILADYRL